MNIATSVSYTKRALICDWHSYRRFKALDCTKNNKQRLKSRPYVKNIVNLLLERQIINQRQVVPQPPIFQKLAPIHMTTMAFPVVEFSKEGYKISKVFG